MKNAKKKLIIAIMGLLIILFTINVTYALWKVRKFQDGETIVASDCFNLEISNGNLSLKKMVPLVDEKGLKTSPYNITINNTCEISAEVGITLDILKTTIGDLTKYKIALDNAIKKSPVLIATLEDEPILNSDTLSTKFLGNVYLNGKSSKTLSLRVWMDEKVEIGEGDNYIFESKVSLTANAIPVQMNSVQEKIIADNGGILNIRGKKNVNFDDTLPKTIYEEQVVKNDSTKLSMLAMAEKKYASTYEFDAYTGKYNLINPVSDSLSEDKVGMYTCNDTIGSACTTMYKVLEADINPVKASVILKDPVEKNMNVTSSLTGSKKMGKGYTINEKGQFVLTDVVTKASFTEDYIGYYVCGNNANTAISIATTCNFLHKIKAVETDPGEGTYYSKETDNQNVSYASSLNMTIAQSYSFDNVTGNYTLENPTLSVSYSEDYIDYYTCNTDGDTCTTLYQIKEVDGTTAVKVNKLERTKRYNRLKKTDYYARTLNYSYITLTDKYTKKAKDYVKGGSQLLLSKDDNGDTYYFRGSNEKNNIYFGGYYWNIIRINGDGSLRIIYRGITPEATGSGINSYFSNGTLHHVISGSTEYDRYELENAHIGYMYGLGGSHSYKLEHENKYNSVIKGTLTNWYKNNMFPYKEFISDSIFCNDRSIYSGEGYGYSLTTYNPHYRITASEGMSPTFKCPNKNDRFTVTNSIGNMKNDYPVGLITADEAIFAGLHSTTLTEFNYLNTGINYWTMSPDKYDGSNGAYIYIISSSGKLQSNRASYPNVARPVINLKGNVKLTGTGTIEDPYIVDGFVEE